LDGIEERIDARAHLEKELLIKERDVKQGRAHEKMLNEFEMQKQDTMIHNSKCNSSRENTNAGDGKIVEKIKKDNQTLKEENVLLKKEIETFKERVRDLEKKPDEFINYKTGLEYTDPCPLGQAIACTPKLYDAEVLGLHYVQPDVNDTEEILNDAEANESDVPPKEMSNKSKLLKLFVNLDNEIKKLATFNIDLKMDKHRTGLYEDRKGIQ
ncbi:hypothetical protein Tco_1388579, partial [Tanacetum coccineum]